MAVLDQNALRRNPAADKAADSQNAAQVAEGEKARSQTFLNRDQIKALYASHEAEDQQSRQLKTADRKQKAGERLEPESVGRTIAGLLGVRLAQTSTPRIGGPAPAPESATDVLRKSLAQLTQFSNEAQGLLLLGRDNQVPLGSQLRQETLALQRGGAARLDARSLANFRGLATTLERSGLS